MMNTSPATLAEARGKMTQSELAMAIGVNSSTIGHWETRRHAPNGPVRRQLALALGVDLATVDRWFAAAPEPANANQPAAAAGAR